MQQSFQRLITIVLRLAWLYCAWLCCALMPVHAATYANVATTYGWIDATAHTKIGYNTVPYKFNGGFGCGTTPPTLDDTLSDIIPIGFNFVFGNKVFDAVRIQSNGRVQFVSTTLPLDNTTCSYGSPVTVLPIPNASLNYTMRVYGSDLDPTLKSEVGGYATNCTSRTGATPCFVSVGNVGVVPGSRKFVVTWSNVPEWAAASTASGSYNVQIIIQENGSFIYQYGTDVAGPQASNGQVGWQISTSDYEAPSVGYPVPGTAVLFFVPHPVAEYLMEQASWSGSGAVLDSSGNGSNATHLGAVQTTSAGKICRGADISAAGTNAISTGIGISTIGNAGTIAFWYKSNTAWSGGGTQDVQLLDATTVNGQWFSLVRRGGAGANGGKLRFVVTDSTNTTRAVETAAMAVAGGTFKHIAITWNFNNIALPNNDRLRIYVDGVQQAQTTLTSTTLTLSAAIGPLNIGGTSSGWTETGAVTTSADGVIDEFRAYNYEASAASIVTLRDLNSGGCMSHYAVAAPAAGLSCQASAVTVSPHTNAHTAYVSNSKITLSTSDGKGDWVLNNGLGVMQPGPVNTGVATYTFGNETQVILSLTHPTTGTVTVGVTDGISAVTENTPIVISTCASGKFIACEVSSPRCTPVVGSVAYANLFTKLANTAFKLDLSALKIDGSVDTTFNGTIAVKLLASSATPASFVGTTYCPTTPSATIPLGNVTLTSGRPPVAGVSVLSTAFSAVAPTYSAYPDVRVQFVCTSPACSPAVTACSPDAFTVRPQTFTVTSSNANADSAAGTSATNAPTIKTGVAFTLTAGTSTKGYFGLPVIDATKVQWPGAPAGGRAAPGAGSVVGTFNTPASVGTGNGATGNFAYDEVGYFQFAAGGVYDSAYAAISGDVGNGDCTNDASNTLVSGKYGCRVANQAATNYFGRFIPDHFSLVNPVLTPGCVAGSYTYMDQPFNLTASIEAQNSFNSKTQNYTGASFAKGIVSTQAENNNNGTALGSRLTFTAPWTNGVASYSTTRFSRPVSATADSTWGPFDALSVGVKVADSDGVVFINRNMDETNNTCSADTAGMSDGTCSAVTVASGAKLRFGRLRLQNAYGSELLPLPMSLTAQYWNGTGFVLNTLDNCTALPVPTSASGMVFGTGNLAAGETTASIQGLSTGSGVLLAGDAAFRLTAPGAGNNGNVTITVATPSGLKYPWTSSTATDASARATFGIYKSPLIYRRENY